MKNFTTINDLTNLTEVIREAILLKMNPFEYSDLGKRKTLVMLFFNSSLRTRLSTEKAAKNLGMDVICLNVNDTWNLEYEDGSIMNMNTTEHVKEAAQVISQYADMIAIRAFPTLNNKSKDESEVILSNFITHASVPIINMESSTAHPLQALADAITISELTEKKTPKVVLSWAPHPKALPHAVVNSFIPMMHKLDVELTITHPQGYELNSEITNHSTINYNQNEALEGADFVYVKNWCSYTDYGKILSQDKNWMMTTKKLGKAKFMHCLPLRRNIIAEDAVLESENSVIMKQANNRTYAAQVVLKKLLQNL